MRENAYGPRQSRGGRVRVYVCCCPFTLLFAPFILLGRLARHGALALAGRPVGEFWATPTDRASNSQGQDR